MPSKEKSTIKEWLDKTVKNGITKVSCLDAIEAGFTVEEFDDEMTKLEKDGVVCEC